MCFSGEKSLPPAGSSWQGRCAHVPPQLAFASSPLPLPVHCSITWCWGLDPAEASERGEHLQSPADEKQVRKAQPGDLFLASPAGQSWPGRRWHHLQLTQLGRIQRCHIPLRGAEWRPQQSSLPPPRAWPRMLDALGRVSTHPGPLPPRAERCQQGTGSSSFFHSASLPAPVARSRQPPPPALAPPDARGLVQGLWCLPKHLLALPSSRKRNASWKLCAHCSTSTKVEGGKATIPLAERSWLLVWSG